MSPKLIKIVDLNMSDVFKKVEELSLGKSIYFHDLGKSEVEQLKERFSEKGYLIREKEDIYFPTFSNDGGIKKYMVLVDRIFGGKD